MIIRPKLIRILIDKGITQNDLADKCGIPQAAISRFDRHANHKDQHLFAISRALDLFIEDLFDVSDE